MQLRERPIDNMIQSMNKNPVFGDIINGTNIGDIKGVLSILSYMRFNDSYISSPIYFSSFIDSYIHKYIHKVPYFAIYMDDICIASRYPTGYRIDNNTFHSLTGPSIKWADGYQQFYVSGIFIDEQKYIDCKQGNIDLGDIMEEQNIEMRNALITLCGFEHLVRKILPIDTLETNSYVTGKNTICELYVIRLGRWHDMKFISLEDHSTHKRTFLPVPPRISSVKEGIAWSFNIPETYIYNYES